MVISWIFWLALGAGSSCVALGLAMSILVLWQSHLRVENILAALFNFTVIMWGCHILGVYLTAVALGFVPSILRRLMGVSPTLNTLFFLGLVVAYTRVWRARWAQVCLAVAAASACVVLWLSVSDALVTSYAVESGAIAYDLTPQGRVAGLSTALFMPIGTAILYRYRDERTRLLLVGGVVGTAALVTRFIPSLMRLPLGPAGGAATAFLVARAILKEQLFDPLAEKNRHLLRLTDDLRDSEAKLSALISNTDDLIWSVDRSYRVVAVNKVFAAIYERMYGAALTPGTMILEWIPPEESAIFRGNYDRALAGERVSFEREFGAEERAYCLDIALSPIRDRAGVITGVAGFARDITERKRAEKALSVAKDAAEAANRAKSIFLASMSHELRTPLNSILGYSELLAESAKDDGRAQDGADLAKILNSGGHLLTLINNILDLSKIEADKVELRLSTFNIRALALRAAAAVAPAIAKNKNVLHVEVSPEAGDMRGDATRVQQVLLNLLSNAAKFTHEGTITLRVWPEGGGGDGAERISFAVEDTGIGISEEQQSALFEPFVQAHSGISQSYGGTGLGLALSRRLCSLMKGTLTARSEPGKGSVFTATLPKQLG